MTTLVIRFTLRVCRESLSICVCASFPHGYEGRIWGLIVLVPDHCISFHTQSRIRLEPPDIPIFIDCKQAPSEMFKTSVIKLCCLTAKLSDICHTYER